MRKKCSVLLMMCIASSLGISACRNIQSDENIFVVKDDYTEESMLKEILPVVKQYEDVVQDDWHYSTKLLETGFTLSDLIRIAGNLYYDRYTRVVYLHIYGRPASGLSPYYGPHGHLCKYSLEENRIIEIE